MSDTVINDPPGPDAKGPPFTRTDPLIAFLAGPGEHPPAPDSQAEAVVTPDVPVPPVHSREHEALERSVILIGLTCAVTAIILSAAIALPLDLSSIARFDALRNAVQIK